MDVVCRYHLSRQVSQGLRELQQSIIGAVLRLPGNDCCCDCTSHNGTFTCRAATAGPAEILARAWGGGAGGAGRVVELASLSTRLGRARSARSRRSGAIARWC